MNLPALGNYLDLFLPSHDRNAHVFLFFVFFFYHLPLHPGPDSLLFFFRFLFFSIIVYLHCSVDFCCTAKWHTHMRTHTYTHSHTHSFSYINLHHVLSQVTGYSSLCCIVGPHCLFIWLWGGESSFFLYFSLNWQI